ncbi:MAG TPA: M12 family metallo-peptidase, partial [Thermoanaerobaculia bacterium]|nr:M12 family metallo-peptidase [Thermoanaerobaculia bacterium]
MTVRGFPLDPARSADLELHRFELFSPSARSVEVGAGGTETDAPLPDAAFYEGRVAGDPDSRVFLSAFGAAIHAIVQRGEETWSVEPLDGWRGGAAAHVVHRLSTEEWAALSRAWRCDEERLAAGPSREAMLSTATVSDTGQPFSATVAVDTDYELFHRFGDAATERNYVSNELAAVSAIYWRDLHTRLTIGFLRVWTSTADPWSATDPLSALFQVGDYWHAHGSGVARSTVVFLSGKNLGGGVAWLSTICQGDQFDSADGHWAGGYAVVGNIEGSMTQFHDPPSGSDVWDVEAVAHELGHNFGSVHTHCYSPPIDECYGKEPGCYSGPNVDPGPGVGTIMSYCHLFGWSEISLKFHARCISEQLRPTILNAASLSPGCMAGGVFTDVSSSDPLASSVSTIAAWGIIPGCTATTFCPNRGVSRADMAVFVERGLNVFVPPPNQPQVFADVPPGAYAYDFIEDFSKRGITNGCTATAYCPSYAVSRAQMAIFLLRAEHGSAYAPPPATGTMFSDVPAGAFAAAW